MLDSQIHKNSNSSDIIHCDPIVLLISKLNRGVQWKVEYHKMNLMINLIDQSL